MLSVFEEHLEREGTRSHGIDIRLGEISGSLQCKPGLHSPEYGTVDVNPGWWMKDLAWCLTVALRAVKSVRSCFRILHFRGLYISSLTPKQQPKAVPLTLRCGGWERVGVNQRVNGGCDGVKDSTRKNVRRRGRLDIQFKTHSMAQKGERKEIIQTCRAPILAMGVGVSP